jgi:beta-xylosidase
MKVESETRGPQNPVYEGYFADPFAWKYGNTYYAVGTGESEAGGRTEAKVFPLLESSDFLNWRFVGKVLERPDVRLGANFWAPAIAAVDERFYLYYSVGHGDKEHQLRVAISDEPQGPYRDSGTALIKPAACAFAIDPHPFQDADGQWYLFYARDFLDYAHPVRAGTALEVAAMRSMIELEKKGICVMRARSDWQRFESNRLMNGRVWDWHTLEGPCVHMHEGRYYCFYSGGRWEDETYGVDYGVADQVTGPYSDAGSEAGPRVLRTVPGQLMGPGHNTIITGPDGETEFICYHAWDREMKARRMFLSKLVWTADGPRCADEVETTNELGAAQPQPRIEGGR